jgi:hypothetical protein
MPINDDNDDNNDNNGCYCGLYYSFGNLRFSRTGSEDYCLLGHDFVKFGG